MTPLGEISPTRVAEAWNGSCDRRFRLDPDVVRLNLHEHPLFHQEASLWEGGAFVAVKRSAAALYSGPSGTTAHLSLFGGESAAIANLLSRAVERLVMDGTTTLVVGMDSGHFLPGAPEAIPWVGPFLESIGFVAGGEAFDLERDLDAYRLPNGLPDGEFRPLIEADRERLESFLVREFPGRWHYDVLRKIDYEGIQTVFGLFEDRRCEGFALLQSEGDRLPIGGAVWRSSLGPSWASLGPIGISRSVRGRGLGNALLSHALDYLNQSGARRTIIDWTGLVDFYGAHDFIVTRAYRSYRLDL